MVEWTACQRKKTEKNQCLNMKGYSRNIKLLQPIAAYLQAQTSFGKESNRSGSYRVLSTIHGMALS
jgi:hypothetical protein